MRRTRGYIELHTSNQTFGSLVLCSRHQRLRPGRQLGGRTISGVVTVPPYRDSSFYFVKADLYHRRN